MLLWCKNQFSFLLTRLLFFLISHDYLVWWCVHHKIHVIIFCSSWVETIEIDWESQWCHFINRWHVQNHGLYHFRPTNFKDFLRTNYSFLLNYGDIYDFSFLSFITFCDNMTAYDLKLHLRYRNRIWNKESKQIK